MDTDIKHTRAVLQAAGILEEHKVLVNQAAITISDEPWYQLVHHLATWKLQED